MSTTYSLRTINGHTLELTPTGTGFCLLGSGVILLTFVGWGIAWQVGWLPRYATTMSVGMSTVATVVLAIYLVLQSLCGRIYFDNRTRVVRVKPGRRQGWAQWTFDDFLVVQITPLGEDDATASAERKHAYQVNLTYRSANGEVAHFPLLIGHRKNALKRRARRLAEFMGLPLISETATSSAK